MEKIKNMLSNTGNRNDDVAASDNTTGTTSGQTSGLTSGTTTGNTGLTGEGSHLAGNRENLGSTNTSSGLTGQNTTGVGNTQNTTGLGNTQNSTGLGSTQNTQGTTTAGPHSSNLANKADPRVDSDLDGSRTVGNTGGVGNTSTGTGYGSSTGNTTAQSGNTGFSGPHQTEAANRLDPSVNTSGATGLESAHHHSETHGGGAEEADTHHSSHLGRDAAVGAGGVGLAEHEHHKHDKDLTPAEREAKREHKHELKEEKREHHNSSHVGRDAAVGAGGAGLAEHEHHKHQNERGTGVGGNTGSTGLGSSAGAYDNTTGSSTTGTGHQSHVGRDAGIGAAGVGAAGLAEHEHSKHSAATASSLPGPAPNTAGPHKQDWLNKLDPRVNANPDQPQSTGHGPLKVEEGKTGTAKPYDPTTGYVSNPRHHGVTDVNPDGSTSRHANPTHHGQSRANDLPGHDAAAVGAVGGAGAYEAGKHRDQQTGSGIGGMSTTTSGPHSSNIANKADPTVDSDRSKDHHYGRDAGIAGGVGAAAYEADKHHQKHDKDLTPAEREAKKEHKHELKEEKREHKESKGGLLSFLHRDKNKKYTPEEEAEFDREEREHNSSHKGRDALGGAALGGAAYEGEKHHREHQNTSAVEGDTNKALPTAPGNHGIGTGAGTQNALAGDNTSSGHHLGRDAALVGGAGAVGEHEHNKHSGTTGTAGTTATPLAEKPRGTDLGDKLHGVERNRGVPGPTGFPDSQGVGSTSSTTGQHHYGRDTAAVGGAAAVGEHEHRKHEGAGSTGVGNQSSGITSSSTGTGNQHHLGRDAAVGAGGVGLAEHEHRKHEGVGNTSSGLTGSNQGQYDNTSSGVGSTTGTGNQHHYGRDAAGVGAAGLVGEHEYKKHEAKHDNTTSGYGSQGLGSGSEYRKDDLTSGQQYGTTGQQSQQYGTTGQESIPRGAQSGYDSKLTDSGVGSGVGGDRNRLHKDPPADHPAAQGGVPASGT